MSRAVRSLVSLALGVMGGLAAVLVAAAPAHACSCVGGTPQQDLARNDVVFEGRVTDVDERGGVATLEVLRVWKGDVPAEVQLADEGDTSSCGSAFLVGEEPVVFAVASGDGLSTGLCNGFASPAQLDRAVGGSQPPGAGPPIVAEPSYAVPGLGLLLSGALASVLGLGGAAYVVLGLGF